MSVKKYAKPEALEDGDKRPGGIWQAKEVNKMVDQSYYKKADEIIEHYEAVCCLINPHHAGYPGGISAPAWQNF